jgi:hypothetical protein
MKKACVICFYWEGDRWKKENTPTARYDNLISRTGTVNIDLVNQYITNLYKGVKRNTTKEFDFICFTNEPVKVDTNIQIKPLPMITTVGVLPRMYMFSKESGLWGRQVLCLDLDIVIVGNIDPLLEYTGEFCTRSKFMKGEEYKLDGDIMSFKAGQENTERFWAPFVKNPEYVEELTNGRERYWVRHVAGDIAERWDKIVPGAVISYKRHFKKGKHTKQTAIVSCHGAPRPHQIEDKLIKKNWNSK